MSRKARIVAAASAVLAVAAVVVARPLTGLGTPPRLGRGLPFVGKDAQRQARRVFSTRMRNLQAELGAARDDAEREKLIAEIDELRRRERAANAPVELDNCDHSADCELRSQCGCGNASLGAFRAVNRNSPRPPPAVCKPCSERRHRNDYEHGYYAVCELGRCKAVDVRHSSLSACREDADCIVRGGTGCCEDCGGGLVAVNRAAQSSRAFCDGESAKCAPCVPPKDAEAHCASGHCALTLASK